MSSVQVSSLSPLKRDLAFRLSAARTLSVYSNRNFSLWQKFVPRFLKKEKTETKEIVPSSKDDIRKKIFEAELQEIIELGKKPQEEWMAKQAKRDREEMKKEEELNQGIAELRDDAVANLEQPPVYSIEERLTTFEEKEDGSVELPLLLKDEKPLSFKSKAEYEKWLHEKQQTLLMKYKNELSPHDFYITQGKYMERAFTGQYWWVKDVGIYS